MERFELLSTNAARALFQTIVDCKLLGEIACGDGQSWLIVTNSIHLVWSQVNTLPLFLVEVAMHNCLQLASFERLGLGHMVTSRHQFLGVLLEFVNRISFHRRYDLLQGPLAV